MEYNFHEIEESAQQKWSQNNVYLVSNDNIKPKYYILDMFPYPSGSGLHVGHPLGYIASDIFSRYKRLKGFNVLHPMGFDAFGLPAEQYAIQTGQHPAITTAENIITYKDQLRKIGFSYDWSREVNTSNPSYYKWTQWIFLQLFDSWYDINKGIARPISELILILEKEGNTQLNAACNESTLIIDQKDWQKSSEKQKSEILMCYRIAYLSESIVNWCEGLGTVLANDEIKEGVSERGGYPIERKVMTQWFLRITAYAERLLSSLNLLDWTDSMKEMQRNWIGKSYGASMIFKTADGKEEFEIFTTRPDTIFGVTFMVLAPEHELIKKITTEGQKQIIEEYLEYVNNRSEIERQQEKKVTGAFTGAYAINPLNGEKVPIYISEYVLAGYGTGAIMAVPSDDERDEAFAKKFNISIIEVIDKSKYPNATKADKLGVMINSDFINDMEVPDAIDAINKKIEAMGIGKAKINYKLRDAGFSRQRYWGEPFPIYYEDGVVKALRKESLPIILPEINEYKPADEGKGPLYNAKEWINELGNGKVRESDTMPGYAGSSWYFLRYMDPHNEDEFVGLNAVNYWKDVDLYIGGTEHAVGHLLYSRFWHKFFKDKGWVSTEEPFKRLVNQGMIQGVSAIIKDGSIDNFPVDVRIPVNYVTQGNKIYKKDLLALKSVDNRFDSVDLDIDVNWETDERGKYISLRNEVEKMSKRYMNVVNPNEIIENHGADCFRMFEMFLGPIEYAKPWDTQGIGGVSKFLQRLWRLFNMDEEGNIHVNDRPATNEELKILHKTIKKVNEDIERLSLNTAVSAFMVCVNELGRSKDQSKQILEQLVILISPFAPFIAEELWGKLGYIGCILNDAKFPIHNEQYLVEAIKTYPISINGKVRAKLDFSAVATQSEIEKAVIEHPIVLKWLEGKPPKKVIVVPGKIVNVVI